MTQRKSGSETPGSKVDDGLWQEEIPTAITDRPNLASGKGTASESGLPSMVEEADRAPGSATTLNPPPASRGVLAGASLPDFLKASLEVVSGPDASRVFEITMVRTVLGRGERTDIRLDDEKASRRHASIVYIENEFRVRDEGSGNGTFLNGSRVVEYALRNGDKLLIGNSLLRFHRDVR